MDPQLATTFQEIAEGYRKLAAYYSNLAAPTEAVVEQSEKQEDLEMSVPQSPIPQTKETPKGKKVRDPNAPKRPMSSFFIFVAEKREAFKAAHPEMGATEIARELGNLWKTVDQTQYTEKYQQMMNVYRDVMSNYTSSKDVSSEEPSNEASPSKAEKPKKVRQKKEKAAVVAVVEEKSESVPEEKASSTPVAAAGPASPKRTPEPAKTIPDIVVSQVSADVQSAEKEKKKKTKKSKSIDATAENAEQAEASLFQPEPKKQKKNKEKTVSASQPAA